MSQYTGRPEDPTRGRGTDDLHVAAVDDARYDDDFDDDSGRRDAPAGSARRCSPASRSSSSSSSSRWRCPSSSRRGSSRPSTSRRARWRTPSSGRPGHRQQADARPVRPQAAATSSSSRTRACPPWLGGLDERQQHRRWPLPRRARLRRPAARGLREPPHQARHRPARRPRPGRRRHRHRSRSTASRSPSPTSSRATPRARARSSTSPCPPAASGSWATTAPTPPTAAATTTAPGPTGSVPMDKIVGRALFVVWPIDHVTWLGVPERTFAQVPARPAPRPSKPVRSHGQPGHGATPSVPATKAAAG